MATRKKAETSNQAETSETGAEKIWNKIKDLPVELFALPEQTVQMHAKREEKLEKATPDTLYLLLKSGAVRHALEEAMNRVRLGQNELGQPLAFQVEEAGKYTTIKIVPRDI